MSEDIINNKEIKSVTADDDSRTKSKQKFRTRKRKRKDSSEDENTLPENALELEKNVHASAIKNNLDDASVKKILKKVVTNDHVLALVKLKEEEEEQSKLDQKYEPIITRAKVKDKDYKLAPWNVENIELTPIKHIPVKTAPEVVALIAQELPEDEDDEEYQPTHDDVMSDDDQTDTESLPRTPVTERRPSVTSPKLVNDGPFKIPQDITPRKKANLEEEATIALRTRSKLSLSATPIEHIESSFIPPDDIPTVDVDDPVWNEFLEGCLNPTSNVRNEDDDDTDPEYNVAADQDDHDEDEDALENSIIKISKKEIDGLLHELLSIMPEATDDELLVTDVGTNELRENADHELGENKQLEFVEESKYKLGENTNHELYENTKKEEKPHYEGEEIVIVDENKNRTDKNTLTQGNNSHYSIDKNKLIDSNEKDCTEKYQKNEISSSFLKDSCDVRVATRLEKLRSLTCVETPTSQPPKLLRDCRTPTPQLVVRIDSSLKILPEQIQILRQQFRQHIQLATTNFLQLFVHPVHWKLAPKYKEYLVCFHNMWKSNPKTVVNVCNMLPAFELILSWEKSLSECTPENEAYVEFVKMQVDRSINRFNQNCLYVGDFHNTFLDTVANSTVFLYPYLLPSMPYRAGNPRRSGYLHSEDALIALGLAEFWDYVEMNPKLYPIKKQPKVSHRLGLKHTLRLLCKHMLTWFTPPLLLTHVHWARQKDKDNPIYKFFKTRKVEPVRHTLIPFNPNICLYEHPEYEMPRIWLRHLAKTSKRFRNYFNRRTNVTGLLPRGVEVNFGKEVLPPQKKPLCIDFANKTTRARAVLVPNASTFPKQTFVDKNDVDIEKKTESPSQPNAGESNFMTLVPTSNGILIVPFLSQMKNVTSIVTPICSPAVTNSRPLVAIDIKAVQEKNSTVLNKINNFTEKDEGDGKDLNTVEKNNETPPGQANIIYDTNHCKCCDLLRNCKQQQRCITDYFKSNRKQVLKTCPCKSVRYPKITNRLKLLLSLFKNHLMGVHKELESKLCNNDINEDPIRCNGEFNKISTFDDLAYVTSFNQKLWLRLALARNTKLKFKIYKLFSQFDPEEHDPVELSQQLEKVFDVELVDMFKEFLRFLTPEQADKANKFKDYFTHHCISELVKRIDEQVKDKNRRQALLSRLNETIVDCNLSACETCAELLKLMDGYSQLARYTFSLFPHTKQTKQTPQNDSSQINTINVATNAEPYLSEHEDDQLRICEDTQTFADYEMDHCSSDVDGNIDCGDEHDTRNNESIQDEQFKLEEKYCPEIKSENVEQEEISEDCEIQLNVTETTENTEIKSERPEWQRSEDKLILEILKQYLIRQERKEKTILEILEEKEIVQMISENLSYKSIEDVTDRLLYLIEMLVLNKN